MANITLLPVLFLLSMAQCGLGQIQHLVHNGENLNPEKNKHLVKLEITKSEYEKNTCSGSIISDRWILTAAHCVVDFQEIIVQYQKGGTFYKLAKASKVFLRDPSYDKHDSSDENYENDLALILTRQRIKFDDHIQSIKLARRLVPENVSALISGYGEIRPGVEGSSQGVVVTSTCPSQKTLTAMICSRGNVSSGQGDSGGPLVYKGRLAGVTSWGLHDKFYEWTGYVSVAANFDWIRNVMREN